MRNLPIVRPGGKKHIAIARAVHDLLGENRLPSLLGLKDDTLHAVAVLDDIDTPRVKEHLDARLGDHLVHQVLGPFRIDGRLPMLTAGRTLRADIRPQGRRTDHELLANATRHQCPLAACLAAGSRKQDEDHSICEKPAQRTVPLHKCHLDTRPCGGDSRCETRRAAPHHDDIRLMENRHFTRRLEDLPILYERTRTIRQGMLKGKDVFAKPEVVRVADRTWRQPPGHGDVLVAKGCARGETCRTQSKFLQEFTLRDLHGFSPTLPLNYTINSIVWGLGGGDSAPNAAAVSRCFPQDDNRLD